MTSVARLTRRHGDDMGMDDMGMGGGSQMDTLSASGVDFSNETQAANFLESLLNDDMLKVEGARSARYFWYGVVVSVAMAMLYTFSRWLVLQQRLRDAARRKAQPARPKSFLTKWHATITALGREATYWQLTPAAKHTWMKVPPMGNVFLIATYLAFVLALEFSDNNTGDAQYWQSLGVRAGWLAIAQMPLLILLINKNSIIGALTGTSWERLNVLHRWSARILLLLAIFHFAFQSHGWQNYGVMMLEWETDDCPSTGIAAFAILLWMNISTAAPLRYMSYEFFVAQHVITFFGFIIAVMFHLPSTALSSRVYIYIPIGIYLVDRIIRTLVLAWNNICISRTNLVQMDGRATKLRISNKAIKNWRPGSHVLLSVPKYGFMQSHPATILSTPTSHSGDLVFVLKGHRGFTNNIYQGANTSTEALVTGSEKSDNVESNGQVIISSHLAIIDGPYGGSQADFAAFDSVCLIAGSTGVTFTLSLLQDIADRVSNSGKNFPVQTIHFVWCVKDSNWVRWISQELIAAYEKVRQHGIELEISIFVTCADNFTEHGDEEKRCGCQCDKSKGPCCCVVIDEDDEVEQRDAITSAKGPEVILGAGSTASSQIVPPSKAGKRIALLPCARFYSGRPDVREVLSSLLDGADGESAVAVCGPTALISTVRNEVVRLSDERAIHKGTGAQGCYLHAENFS